MIAKAIEILQSPTGNNPAIKPIETKYLGYRFRSRLEARWAVFFTHMGISFRYEPEGWNLPSGERYLPDFFLPQVRTWAEVKPAESAIERQKCESVAIGQHQLFLFLVGPPEFQDYEGAALDGGILEYHRYRLDINYNGIRFYRDQHRLFSDPQDQISEASCSEHYREAVYASRAARFDGTDALPSSHELFDIVPAFLITGLFLEDISVAK